MPSQLRLTQRQRLDRGTALSGAKVGRTDCMRRLFDGSPLSESVYGARLATRRHITKL